MLELTQCPVCRLRRRGDEPQDQPCRRCHSDLSQIHRTYAQARALQQRAREALGAGDARTALKTAHRAVTLVDVPETRSTLCAALGAAGQPSAALDLLVSIAQTADKPPGLTQG